MSDCERCEKCRAVLDAVAGFLIFCKEDIFPEDRHPETYNQIVHLLENIEKATKDER